MSSEIRQDIWHSIERINELLLLYRNDSKGIELNYCVVSEALLHRSEQLRQVRRFPMSGIRKLTLITKSENRSA